MTFQRVGRVGRSSRPTRSRTRSGTGGGGGPTLRGIVTNTSTSASGTVNFASLNPQAGDLAVVYGWAWGGAANNTTITGYTRVTSFDTGGSISHKILADGETTLAWASANGAPNIAVAVFSGVTFGSGGANTCAALGGSNTTTALSPGSRTAPVGGFLLAGVVGTSGGAAQTAGTFSPAALQQITFGQTDINMGVAVYEGTGAGINAIHTHVSAFAFNTNNARFGAFAILNGP